MFERLTWRRLWKRVESWVRWSNTVCATMCEPGPMTPPRVARTLANGGAPDLLFCALPGNLHLHLEHDPVRVVEMGDFRFSES